MSTPRYRPRSGRPRGAVAWCIGLMLVVSGACAGGSSGDRGSASGPAAAGKRVAATMGCASCHGTDGGGGVGPPWKGLGGSTVKLSDGTVAVADDAYIRRSIRDPKSQVVKGYGNVMPKVDLTDEQVDDLVAYIESLRTGNSNHS